jgi:restriction system protein
MLDTKEMINYRKENLRWEEQRKRIIARNDEDAEDHKSRVDADPRMISYRDAMVKYNMAWLSLKNELEEATLEWETRRESFAERLRLDKLKVESLRILASRGDDAASRELTRIVANFAVFPFYFPRPVSIVPRSSEKLMYVEIIVPAASNIRFVEYKSVRGQLKEVALSAKIQQYWYEYLVYSMVVRLIFDISVENALDLYETIATNVMTKYKSPITGLDTEATIASVVLSRSEAKVIDTWHINPTETFRAWKGVSAKVLSDLVPVQPTIVFDKNDDRLVQGKDVLSELSKSENLASMDWEDFEHLVRQLFELEFKSSGADVRITRSSRDRGVDAIIFDPDPIKGGKIVIQAKRYTNTVDVSSVRDLFGTVQNEGANRGILVTTSHYGTDSREFARGKPLTLVDGPNLLSLLQKHGFNFRLDLSEARQNRDVDR